jgi:hypothetical protein
MTQGKTRGKYINLSEEWELNYCLEKYNFKQDDNNRKKLIKLIQDAIKPYFSIKSIENLSWDQIDEYYNLSPKGFSYNKDK